MPLFGASLIRITIMAAWLLSPPLLVLFALREWNSFRKQQASGWKTALPVITGIAVLADWALFIGLIFAGQIGGFGTHFITNRHVWVLPWLSLLLLMGVIAAPMARGKLAAAIALVFALWAGSLFVA